jgi:hypothetical protein
MLIKNLINIASTLVNTYSGRQPDLCMTRGVWLFCSIMGTAPSSPHHRLRKESILQEIGLASYGELTDDQAQSPKVSTLKLKDLGTQVQGLRAGHELIICESHAFR